MKMNKLSKRKAFTLIELLIVIAIIGILFIVLVSKVDFATDKAKATGVQTDFRSFQMAFDTVAKENAGFNTFGWDTGDANQDGIRNSYDEGDTNKNGIQDGTEVFTGHKVYDETFTKVYSLKKNGTGNYDRDALNRLETAINANLDPKLHITIKDDGEIVMANGAQDPWNKEYHGWYITNAEIDKADRGAIVMYSDGANNEFGSEHDIANGVPTVIVPGNNKDGADDYSLVVCYTYTNGYGEVGALTTGFSNNQTFLTGNGGSVNNAVTPGGNGGTLQLPSEDPTATIDSYTWQEILALSNAQLSAKEYKEKYGIEVGQKKDDQYFLVDLDGNDYEGFVFMFNAKIDLYMDTAFSTIGGYTVTPMARQVESLYANLTNSELKSVIKKVSVNCSDEDPLVVNTDEYHMFLASYTEVGFVARKNWEHYNNEGYMFDYFLADVVTQEAKDKRTALSSTTWWLRTATTNSSTRAFEGVADHGGESTATNSCELTVVPCFVIGNDSKTSIVPIKSSLNEYSWQELKTLSQSNISNTELISTYNINLGDYKLLNGRNCYLVDYDGNDYDGFVFMYDSGISKAFGTPQEYLQNLIPGYSNSLVKSAVDEIFNSINDSDFKNNVKVVNVMCNDYSTGVEVVTTELYTMFLPSDIEIGSPATITELGKKFDFFPYTANAEMSAERTVIYNKDAWLRQSCYEFNKIFKQVNANGIPTANEPYGSLALIPCFVIG